MNSAATGFDAAQGAEKAGSMSEKSWRVPRFPFHSIRLAMRVTLIITAMY
ncbi:MAG TPA: hypothetical protein VFN23_05070 [Ktedonobacteraceae bacterium]|nr:hypothetical protein [Ktedonobacteraceae bacterium]